MPNAAVFESSYMNSNTCSYSAAARSSFSSARPVTIRKNRLHILVRTSLARSAISCRRPILRFVMVVIERILGEAFQLIEDPGVRVAPYVVDLLRSAGITVKDGVAHIPEALARRL